MAKPPSANLSVDVDAAAEQSQAQPAAAVEAAAQPLAEVTRLLKFSGHENASSQLKASFSFDGRYVLCGGDDHCVYVWRTETAADSKHPDWQKRWERFQGATRPQPGTATLCRYAVCAPACLDLRTDTPAAGCMLAAAHTSSVTAAVWGPPTIRVPTRQPLLQGSVVPEVAPKPNWDQRNSSSSSSSSSRMNRLGSYLLR